MTSAVRASMEETPTIVSSTYTTSTTTDNSGGEWDHTGGTIKVGRLMFGEPGGEIVRPFSQALLNQLLSPRDELLSLRDEDETLPNLDDKDEGVDEMPKRLVRVVIADPHKDVPADQSLLYNGEEMFTDLTDQELYFEIPVKKLLDEHNEKRTKIKKENSKDGETLKPARIGNLIMTVVTIAEFK